MPPACEDDAFIAPLHLLFLRCLERIPVTLQHSLSDESNWCTPAG